MSPRQKANETINRFNPFKQIERKKKHGDGKHAQGVKAWTGLGICKRKKKKTRKHALVQENTHASRKKDLLKKSRT